MPDASPAPAPVAPRPPAGMDADPAVLNALTVIRGRAHLLAHTARRSACPDAAEWERVLSGLAAIEQQAALVARELGARRPEAAAGDPEDLHRPPDP